MTRENEITIEELADFFCMEVDELRSFLESRDFGLNPKRINGKITFSMEDVQEHLQSQYFI